MRPENAIGLGVGDKLYHSIELFVRDRAGVRAERKSSNAIIDPLLLRLFLSQSNAGQLGICINDSRDRIIINMAVFAGDPFHAGDPFVFSLVRQHWAGNYISDRVNAIDLRFKMLVHFDPLLVVELDPNFLRAESFAERPSPDRNEHFVGLEL